MIIEWFPAQITAFGGHRTHIEVPKDYYTLFPKNKEVVVLSLEDFLKLKKKLGGGKR